MAEMETSIIRYHQACFNPLEELYEVAEMTPLTICESCGIVMITENPSIGVRKHALSGRERHMEFIRIGYDQYEWACPVCESSQNLKEL